MKRGTRKAPTVGMLTKDLRTANRKIHELESARSRLSDQLSKCDDQYIGTIKSLGDDKKALLAALRKDHPLIGERISAFDNISNRDVTGTIVMVAPSEAGLGRVWIRRDDDSRIAKVDLEDAQVLK